MKPSDSTPLTPAKSAAIVKPAALYGKRIDMSDRKLPPVTFFEWVEFCWLLIVHPTFRASRNKRKTYYEYRLARTYHTPCR